MTTRTEPSVGTTNSQFALSDLFGGKKGKTPDALANEALQAFTDAQAKLEQAQAAIAVQKAEHEAEIAARQRQLAVADEHHSRLERVKNRFAELLA